MSEDVTYSWYSVRGSPAAETQSVPKGHCTRTRFGLAPGHHRFRFGPDGDALSTAGEVSNGNWSTAHREDALRLPQVFQNRVEARHT